MKTSNTKVKTPAVAFVPQTRDQVVEAIAEIGQRQRERERIQTAMNDQLAAVRQRFEEDAAPHGERISELHHGVQTWCEAHRVELTDAGKTKTVQLASGEIRWRTTPPSVNVRSMKKVLAALKAMGLERFIRTKSEVDKQAVLAEREAVQHIRGISITQREEFVVVPFETKLEEIA